MLYYYYRLFQTEFEDMGGMPGGMGGMGGMPGGMGGLFDDPEIAILLQV